MELRELTQPEQKYTYRQSHQLDAQTGCIGYLRGDFGTTGKEFYSSWFDSMAYLKTPEFQAELDRVINALREDSQYSGILADRSSLSNACRQSTARKFGRDEFGFRLNTQDYAYLLRLNPNRGEYNFYIYCYKRDYLDRHIRNAEYGIRFITPNYREKFRIVFLQAAVDDPLILSLLKIVIYRSCIEALVQQLPNGNRSIAVLLEAVVVAIPEAMLSCRRRQYRFRNASVNHDAAMAGGGYRKDTRA